MHRDRPPTRHKELRTSAWVSSVYFAEGYPYAIVNTVAETMFTELKASLEVIGLTSLFHVPWNLKFLWAPWVDAYETKRWWLMLVELVLVGALGLLAIGTAGADPLRWAAMMFAVIAVLAATHDIAIDGFYLEALDERQQSNYVGYRAAAYRVALTVAAGSLVSLGGRFGWSWAWWGATGLMAMLVVLHALLLPSPETRRTPMKKFVLGMVRPRFVLVLAVLAMIAAGEWRYPVLRPALGALARQPWVSAMGIGGWVGVGLLLTLVVGGWFVSRWRARGRTLASGSYGRSFVDFLEQDRIGLILAFVLTFRLGESFLLKMRYPFLSKEAGMDAPFYGLAIVGAGGVASIGATLIGGRLIARDGLRRWLWPFVLAQNVLNLLYLAVALAPDPAALGLPLLTGLITLEHVGAGLGTSVFMVYLMRCCDPRHRAAHMAILTALMSLGFTLAGVASGFIASEMGFDLYFAFTFVATIPSMLLIPWIPHVDGREPPA